ncbi:unnamed protein product, partial [Tetraodon nigroviridis]
RVFKKASPNGKLTVYLGKRDFVDRVDQVESVDGVVLIDPEYLKERKGEIPEQKQIVLVLVGVRPRLLLLDAGTDRECVLPGVSSSSSLRHPDLCLPLRSGRLGRSRLDVPERPVCGKQPNVSVATRLGKESDPAPGTLDEEAGRACSPLHLQDSSEPAVFRHPSARSRGHWQGENPSPLPRSGSFSHVLGETRSEANRVSSRSRTLASAGSADRLCVQACGVDFEVKAFCAENPEEKIHKRNSVRLVIRKVQYAPEKPGPQPTAETSRQFLMSDKLLHLEASLDKQIYYHGEPISVNVHVTNNTNKTVKKMKVSGMFLISVRCTCLPVSNRFPTVSVASSVRQLADICLFSTAQYKCTVAMEESEVPPARRCRESTNCTFCPQRRGSSQFHLLQSLHRHSISGQQPGQTRSGSGWKTEARRHQLGLQHAVGVARSRRGGAPLSAADGSVFDRLGEGASKEILGIIVSYKVKVKLVVSRGGSVTFTNTFLSRTIQRLVVMVSSDVSIELPFTLMHPKPLEDVDADGEAQTDRNLIEFDTNDDDIIFEDFARQRLTGVVDEKQEEEEAADSSKVDDR